MSSGSGTILLALLAIAQPPVERSRAVDAELAAELANVARLAASLLPIRQETPDGTITVEAMEARGGELITTMSMPVDLDQATFGPAFARQLPIQACADPGLRGLIGRGAVVRYILRDSEGERFTASARSC